MTELRETDRRDALARGGFGLAIAWLGLVHVVYGADVARLFIVPEALPGREWLTRGAGAALTLAGALIVARRHVREAAVAVAAIALLSAALLHLPGALRSSTFGGHWLGTLKWTALGLGALVLARGPTPARWAMAALMIGSGILHVRYTEIVVSLMPAWFPWRTFWAYFTAVTLAAGGVGLLIKPVARSAGTLSSAMFLGFFLLVHVPRALAHPASSTPWSELGESLAYSMIALMLSGWRPTDRS